MPISTVYDLTRLSTRLFNATPNGIDRADMTFARHMFGERPDSYGLALTARGLRTLPASSAGRLVGAIREGWGETDAAAEQAVISALADFLDAGAPDRPLEFPATLRLHARRKTRRSRLGDALAALAFPGESPRVVAPRGAVYLNVSQFPLWVPPYFGWLRERADVAFVPMIHDLLPLEYPEYFRRGEYDRHRRRLDFVVERASAVLVEARHTKRQLLAYAAAKGRANLPVHVVGLPVDPIFATAAPELPAQLKSHPYFLIAGTIEPRKNHLALLQLWRRLVEEQGASAPKLVIIGRRGWENENAVDLLDRSHKLRNHVVEVSGLSSVSLRMLLAGARAMLLPSFGEGYGLPFVEAQAAGRPVIASDIPPFREIGGDAILIDPLDGPGWLRAIRDFAERPRPFSPCQSAAGSTFFETIESALEAIAETS